MRLRTLHRRRDRKDIAHKASQPVEASTVRLVSSPVLTCGPGEVFVMHNSEWVSVGKVFGAEIVG